MVRLNKKKREGEPNVTNFRLTIEYDGRRYSGWQRQGNTDNTIQGKIEQILSRMTGHAVEINGAGRTDAGVHARAQVANVKIRNIKWQEIIKALSLSKKKNYCGRISYANLGVNQLGSVYESLLAFRGFYAEEDYIEVHKANDPSDGTFLVPYSRMSDFDISEVLTDNETGAPIILPKGTFFYRLNGRDRRGRRY